MFAASKTASVSGGYQISRSLRFNSADSAYLNRTPSTTTNRRTWTWSAWVKRGKQGDFSYLFQGSAGNPTGGLDDGTAIRFSNNISQLTVYNLYNSSSTVEVSTSAMLRDPSAWYHIIVAMDTTQATSTDRVKVYINGVQAALNAGGVYPTLNEDLYVNTTNSHLIGALSRDAGAAQLFNDGYMTEINFIDGQALTPSSFGETNAQTGVWQPKAYSGSYGTNGFYLNFSDNSNTTAATLGKDYSGNGNNWTPNNFSVTAGVGNDSLVDSPTSYGVDTGVGGTVRGNYCTLNPISAIASVYNSAYPGINNGAMAFTPGVANWTTVNATMGVSSGKWYWEVSGTTANEQMHGVAKLPVATTANVTPYLALVPDSYSYYINGHKYSYPTVGSAYGASYTTNDVVGVALDMDAGTITFYKNGTSQGVAFTGLSGTFAPAFSANGNSSGITVNCNFGQRPFAYTAPSGFKALCTQNLPTPTIGATTATQTGKFFNPVLYTGNAPSSQSITGVGFQPDFVWIKNRSNAGGYWHGLFDSVRGVNKVLVSNSTMAEDAALTQQLNSFNSDGFTVGTNSDGGNYTNLNGNSYVAWNWKANGSGSTNTAGSITSTVSANTTSGFSVVTYTATGSNATVGHGLGAVPSMIIVKSRTLAGGHWTVYHSALGNTKGMLMNTTDSAYTNSGYWNNTTPTSTVFSIGTDGSVNQNTQNQVAYCFAEVAGYSKFGSYTGNGSADGPFVFTGFRPAYVMFKRTDASSNWYVFDVARNTSNVMSSFLLPNDPLAETSVVGIDFLSNGFKQRGTAADYNASGGTFIYMAFATNPFKYSLAR